MTTQPFTPSVLDEIAELLVCDRDTHRVLDRRFAELGITEPRVELNAKEEARLKAMGLQPGVDYRVQGPRRPINALHQSGVQSRQ